MLVDFADEYGVHHEHDEVHEATGVHMINVEEEFGTPGGEQLTHPEEIDRGLEIALSFSEGQHLEIALELLENDEQLGSDVIDGIEECVHEVLGDLVVEIEQLHSEFVEKVRTGSLLDILLVDDLLEALTFGESQNILGHVSQVDVLDERLHHHDYEVLLRVRLLLEQLDEVVVLQKHIQSHQVHLLEVRIRDSIVDVVLRDERHQLSEELLLLLLLLRTSCNFLAGLLPKWEVTR